MACLRPAGEFLSGKIRTGGYWTHQNYITPTSLGPFLVMKTTAWSLMFDGGLTFSGFYLAPSFSSIPVAKCNTDSEWL